MRQHPPLYKHFSPSVAPRAGGLAFPPPPFGGLGVSPRSSRQGGHVPFLTHQRLSRRA